MKNKEKPLFSVTVEQLCGTVEVKVSQLRKKLMTPSCLVFWTLLSVKQADAAPFR